MWNNVFKRATELYFQAHLVDAGRQQAALDFLEIAQQFKNNHDGIRFLEGELENSKTCYIAARLLAEVADRPALKYLKEFLVSSYKPYLSHDNLRRLWRLILAEFDGLEAMEPFFGSGQSMKSLITEVWLLSETENTQQTAAALLATGEITSAHIKSMSSWQDKSILWEIMHNHRKALIEPEMRMIDKSDIRLTAAFYLALAGHDEPLRFLTSIAEALHPDTSPLKSARACYLLALLARYEPVNAIGQLVNKTNFDILLTVLNACSALRSPLIMEPLLERLSQTDDEEVVKNIVVFLQAVTSSLPDVDVMDFALVSNRDLALNFFREEQKRLDPVKRYHEGELLTLKHLTEDLAGIRHGVDREAYFNLRAITGENYGFDPDEDLMFNLPAINAWQTAIDKKVYLEPGEWGFMGKALPYPSVSDP